MRIRIHGVPRTVMPVPRRQMRETGDVFGPSGGNDRKYCAWKLNIELDSKAFDRRLLPAVLAQETQ